MQRTTEQLLERAAQLSADTGASIEHAALAVAAIHHLWQVADAADRYITADTEDQPKARRRLKRKIDDWKTIPDPADIQPPSIYDQAGRNSHHTEY